MLKELNAAVAGYNEAAKRLNYVRLAGAIDRTVEKGSSEHADEALASLVIAAERLIAMGAMLASQAQYLASKRDLTELPTARELVENVLPTLLECGERLEELE